MIFQGEAVVRLEYPTGIRVMEHYSGDIPRIINLPPGTGHEIENVGDGNMAFIFWAEKVYDPDSHSKVEWEW